MKAFLFIIYILDSNNQYIIKSIKHNLFSLCVTFSEKLNTGFKQVKKRWASG